MLNLIQADLYKLRKSRAIKVLLAMTTVSATVMAVMAYLIPQGQIDASMTGIGFMFSDMNMISILGGVIAGILICGDFDNKTIQDAIASGFGRAAIVIGKAAVLGVAVALVLLPYAVVTAVALGTGHPFGMENVALGFLHLLTAEGGSAFAAADIWKTVFIILTLLLVYAAQLSICVPLAFLLRKPIFVVAIYYGFSILCAQLMRLGDGSHWFGSLFSSTPYGGRHAFMSLETGAGDMLATAVVSFMFMIVTTAVTYAAFRRAELK
ncbi:ABC transporter permease [Paenibacillus arenilitoris]|uniref:ABC transporter permease n=1 Tax=Paenibacillus arenilitoris TaxID=2772299 RepID=A0A927CNW0_9BACL|nr:ABC transporter permease [Paenibacillus arenilitoris]MBD2870337.1 ABC transporter permease [Paenibacillus arenilitoris]